MTRSLQAFQIMHWLEQEPKQCLFLLLSEDKGETEEKAFTVHGSQIHQLSSFPGLLWLYTFSWLFFWAVQWYRRGKSECLRRGRVSCQLAYSKEVDTKVRCNIVTQKDTSLYWAAFCSSPLIILLQYNIRKFEYPAFAFYVKKYHRWKESFYSVIRLPNNKGQ